VRQTPVDHLRASKLQCELPEPLDRVLEREQAGREQLRAAERREEVTPNRSAGRIEDELWDAFLAECKEQGLSNTDGMREMICTWVRTKPAAPVVQDAGSAVDVLSR
jgi:hypothetical protein